MHGSVLFIGYQPVRVLSYISRLDDPNDEPAEMPIRYPVAMKGAGEILLMGR